MSIFEKLFHSNNTIEKGNTTMTNIEKATALINTFATGDAAAARNLLAEGYIQHNLPLAGMPLSAP